MRLISNKIASAFAIIFIISLFLTMTTFINVRPFEGDGEYTVSGGFLLKTHKLVLPGFPLIEEKEHIYRFRGFNTHKSAMLFLIVDNIEAIPCWKISTVLSATVKENGKTILNKRSALNSHYQRMEEKGTSLLPDEKEWFGYFKYKDKNISDKAVPFDAIKTPVNDKECRYWAMGELKFNGKNSYQVSVDVIKNDEKFKDLTGKLILASGWK